MTGAVSSTSTGDDGLGAILYRVSKLVEEQIESMVQQTLGPAGGTLGSLLPVQGSGLLSLIVIEQRNVKGVGNVILLELTRGTDIDDLTAARQLIEIDLRDRSAGGPKGWL